MGHIRRRDCLRYGCKNCGAQYQENSDGVCPACGRPDSRNSTVYYVKRVIGLPGETVDIENGQVFIDGEALDEPYIREPMIPEEPMHFEVPEGCYFVLGDNRENSQDSRVFGAVRKEEITGRAFFHLGMTN